MKTGEGGGGEFVDKNFDIFYIFMSELIEFKRFLWSEKTYTPDNEIYRISYPTSSPLFLNDFRTAPGLDARRSGSGVKGGGRGRGRGGENHMQTYSKQCVNSIGFYSHNLLRVQHQPFNHTEPVSGCSHSVNNALP